jgi:hypothetical protein
VLDAGDVHCLVLHISDEAASSRRPPSKIRLQRDPVCPVQKQARTLTARRELPRRHSKFLPERNPHEILEHLVHIEQDRRPDGLTMADFSGGITQNETRPFHGSPVVFIEARVVDLRNVTGTA